MLKEGPDDLVKHQWLLDCLAESPDRTTASRSGPRSESDWREVVALAARHGVSPLLYERLTAGTSPPAVPERVLQTLREAFLMNGAKNALLYQELAQVLRKLQQDNVPVIVLKGAHLAALVYEKPALRTMVDIDLLVPKSDLARTASRLRDLGYFPEGFEEIAASCEDSRHHLPLMLKPPGPGIEIHWTIANPIVPFSIDTAGLWERARPATIAGVAARVLSPEDLLLHLCVHSASHGLASLGLAPSPLGLRVLCDIAAIVRRHKHDLNWQHVQTRAIEWQAGKSVYQLLWLGKELLQVDVPGAVLASLQPRDFDQRWAALAREQVALAGAEPRPPDPVESVLGPLMVLGIQCRSAVRRGKIGLLLQTAFPSRGRMARYMARHHSAPLNPIRNYSCYLTRAIDWLAKGAGLAWYCATHRRQAAACVRKLRKQIPF
jgi:hypothetical protein